MKKIGVLVSGGGTNLQAIIDACENGIIENGKIAAVVASNDKAYAIERAKKHNIEVEIIKRKDYDNISSYSKAIAEYMINKNIDLIVMAGFLSIIDNNLIDKYQNKIINIHPSLIPSFCGKDYYGLKVHEKALERGIKVTGATVHFVNEEPDGGPIIMQKSVMVKNDDTPEILQKRVMEEAEHIILPQVINLFCNDKIKVINNRVFIE